MPYYRQTSDDDLNDTIERLAQELETEPEPLTAEGPEILADAPTIIEEKGFLGKTNVTVIWDAWKYVSGERRSHVILQAYEKAKGTPAKLQIGTALGITRDQRTRLDSAS
ncbi:hypothetical protein EON81_15385 [bacterium]|nr:MAG: hypothetical protein EON81_15385 [bacterium]